MNNLERTEKRPDHDAEWYEQLASDELLGAMSILQALQATGYIEGLPIRDHSGKALIDLAVINEIIDAVLKKLNIALDAVQRDPVAGGAA